MPSEEGKGGGLSIQQKAGSFGSGEGQELLALRICCRLSQGTDLGGSS